MVNRINQKSIVPWVILCMINVYLVLPYLLRIPAYIKLGWTSAEVHTKLTAVGWLVLHIALIVLSIIKTIKNCNNKIIALGPILIFTVAILVLIRFGTIHYDPVIIDGSAYDKHSYLQR